MKFEMDLESLNLRRISELLLCITVGVVLICLYLRFSIIGALAIPVVLVLFFLIFKYPAYGLYLTAASLPLGYLGVTSSFHGTLTVTRVLALMTAFACVNRIVVTRGTGEFPKTTKNLLLLVFSSVLILSMLTGIDVIKSITGLFYYYSSILFYILVVLLLQGIDEYSRFLNSLLFSFTLILTLGIFSYLSGMEITVQASVSEVRRIKAIGLDPNEFAMILVSIFPLLVNLCIHSFNRRRKIFYLLWACLFFSGALLTYSRASIITLIGISIFILVRSLHKLNRREIMVFLVAGTVILALLPGFVFQRVESLSQGEDDPSLRTRLSYLKVGYEIMKDYPLLGVGPNNFRTAFSRPEYKSEGYMSKASTDRGKKKGRTGRAAHNMYLEVLNEVGILAFILFLSVILLSLNELRTARRIFKRTKAERWFLFTDSLEVGFIALLVNSFFLSAEFFPILWFFIGLASVSLRIAKKTLIESTEEGTHSYEWNPLE